MITSIMVRPTRDFPFGQVTAFSLLVFTVTVAVYEEPRGCVRAREPHPRVFVWIDRQWPPRTRLRPADQVDLCRRHLLAVTFHSALEIPLPETKR